jgi:diazepam-binding inhibitor (GABA receptor modulator, acyl-CoA-binding protein)
MYSESHIAYEYLYQIFQLCILLRIHITFILHIHDINSRFKDKTIITKYNIMAELTLQDQFEFAVAQVRSIPSSGNGPSDQEKLTMYGLYKQATVGDCCTSRPGMLDFTGKAKWDAWNCRKGMASDDAMSAYCNEYLTLSDKYNL